MDKSHSLPILKASLLTPTRDHLQDVTLALSSLQRGFLPKNPRFWQYGLEVNLRGLSTQAFNIDGEEMRATLDLVRHKLRFGGNTWFLDEYSGAEIFNNFKVWLINHGIEARLEEPKFSAAALLNPDQADNYARALWWLDEQFRLFKSEISEGVTSQIFLYAHHFDLSLVWFPFDDDRQLGLGFSTGDQHIEEPYIYLTASPEPAGFTSIKLSAGAYWHQQGFNGAILPYTELQASTNPAKLLRVFAMDTFSRARPLFSRL